MLVSSIAISEMGGIGKLMMNWFRKYDTFWQIFVVLKFEDLIVD